MANGGWSGCPGPDLTAMGLYRGQSWMHNPPGKGRRGSATGGKWHLPRAPVRLVRLQTAFRLHTKLAHFLDDLKFSTLEHKLSQRGLDREPGVPSRVKPQSSPDGVQACRGLLFTLSVDNELTIRIYKPKRPDPLGVELVHTDVFKTPEVTGHGGSHL
jgi:hypothetical protein